MTGQRRHVPLRRCVGCRAVLPKAQLLRLVRGEHGWRIDAKGRAGGRGTWVCNACVERLDERATARALARTFRQDAPHVSELLRPLRDARVAAEAAARGTTTERAAGAATSDTSDNPRHGGTHG